MKRSLLCISLSVLLLAGLFLVISKLPGRPAAGSLDSAAESGGDESAAGTSSGTIAYASGVDALDASQEALLKTYLDTLYNALGQLEKVAFTDLLADSSEAAFAASSLSLQVDMRANAPLDYSLTSYQYTLTCESVTLNEDGTVSVRASEDSTQHFAAFPDVDAQRLDAVHLFVLRQVNGAWQILSQAAPDALFSMLYTGSETEQPEYADTVAVQETKALYMAQMPDYLSAYLAARSTDLSGANDTAILSSADHPYDAAAALAYAAAYIDTRNPDWEDYSALGGNCQNFASQCLYAGGIPMDTTGESVWKWYGDDVSNSNGAYGRSTSWTGVDSFLFYAGSNTGSGLVAQIDAPYASGEGGDLLHFGTSDSFVHATVISQPVQNATGTTVDYLVYSNTSNLRNFPASLLGFSHCTVTKIFGWND